MEKKVCNQHWEHISSLALSSRVPFLFGLYKAKKEALESRFNVQISFFWGRGAGHRAFKLQLGWRAPVAAAPLGTRSAARPYATARLGYPTTSVRGSLGGVTMVEKGASEKGRGRARQPGQLSGRGGRLSASPSFCRPRTLYGRVVGAANQLPEQWRGGRLRDSFERKFRKFDVSAAC